MKLIALFRRIHKCLSSLIPFSTRHNSASAWSIKQLCSNRAGESIWNNSVTVLTTSLSPSIHFLSSATGFFNVLLMDEILLNMLSNGLGLALSMAARSSLTFALRLMISSWFVYPSLYACCLEVEGICIQDIRGRNDALFSIDVRWMTWGDILGRILPLTVLINS